ncbi:hypothetical protein DFH09DRAFT_850669, partial [Mycena vulgaris]
VPPGPQKFNTEPLFTITDYNPGPEFESTSFPHPPLPFTGVGSLEYDLNHGYTLRWASLTAMNAWMKQECLDESIEFVNRGMPPRGEEPGWLEKHIYVCSRQGSGGKSRYRPTKDFTRNISSKCTGCSCRLTIKTYPGTSEVLGLYKSKHSHNIGDANL